MRLIVIALLVAQPLYAADPLDRSAFGSFSANVTITIGGKSVTSEIARREHQTRIAPMSGGEYMLADERTLTIKRVNAQARTYTVQLPDRRQLLLLDRTMPGAVDGPVIARKRIAGRKIGPLETNAEIVTVSLARGPFVFRLFSAPALNGFPVRVEFDGGALGEIAIEYSNIRLVDPPADLFSIPSDYREVGALR